MAGRGWAKGHCNRGRGIQERFERSPRDRSYQHSGWQFGLKYVNNLPASSRGKYAMGRSSGR
ncbi:hypothetical protein M413DRAFT_449889 [Hebeloma cylindrosporum]|uniref:Uncharacterized protein n=1 Tax=Hebeloma cylindrosporum TaxID=76867 RepID=A0A0C3BUY5_HEBCY|nr:hypothetical protein M413DRAFT_449889 [Hebeloma cylindrosporum h7]